MFINRLITTNPALAEVALKWHAKGTIQPDTYVLDLDVIVQNAELMKKRADENGITLYYMLKQIGRNPFVANKLQEVGLKGAVCVDWREALTLVHAGVPLGNVGHLVQTPSTVLPELLDCRPDIITVYSVEKAAEISREAKRRGYCQKVMLRVLGTKDTLYPGQYGGFRLENLNEIVDALEKLDGIVIAGVCSFPCLLYSEATKDFEPLHNITTICEAARILRARGYCDLQINMPSASCVKSIPIIAKFGGTHMEPGHALTGTTPYHAAHEDSPERIGYVYVSEVSHNLDGRGYCFAGGHYRRGNLENGLVGDSIDSARKIKVTPPGNESIDYHFALSEEGSVGGGVLMCFRTQMFVTRSEVAVVSGLSKGKPRLEGIFSAQGEFLR